MEPDEPQLDNRRLNSEAAIASLTAKQRERLVNKRTGGDACRAGGSFEAAYVVYRAVVLAAAYRTSFSIRDDRECFVDDLVVEYDNVREYCQVKSGTDFDWGVVIDDFEIQGKLDRSDGIDATYILALTHSTPPSGMLILSACKVLIHRFGGGSKGVSQQQLVERHSDFADALAHITGSTSRAMIWDLYYRMLGWWCAETRVLDMRTMVEDILHGDMSDIPFGPPPSSLISPELAEVFESFEI